MITLGEKIKQIRKNNKLTQIEFAKSLGISQAHISKIEKNIEVPSKQLLTFISYRYCVNMDWLEDKSNEYSIECGAEREQYINRFNLFRLELENYMKLCYTDDIYEIVDSFVYLVKTMTPPIGMAPNKKLHLFTQIYMAIWAISQGSFLNKKFLNELLEQLEKEATE